MTVANNKTFTAEALAQVERLALRSKTIPMSEGMTLEQVGEQVSRDSMAWLQVFQALHFLQSNPLVTVSPAALDFVRIVAELARNGNMTDGVEQSLMPVDGLLPAGRLGVKSSRAHATAAAATRKLWPNDINKIKAEYARRLGLGERHGAIADLAAQYGVSTKTISRYVKPKAKGK